MPPTGTENNPVIHVLFYDHATGGMFAELHLPADRLPQSFEAPMTLHLEEADWSVVEARPMTAEEFRRSGTLTLILSRVKTLILDPADILFSLATLVGDALPPVAAGSSKRGVEVIEAHEDDWRQVEWVSASAADVIASELDAVRRIYEQERQGAGFKHLHVRRAVQTPLADHPISLEELRRSIGPQATWLAGFAWQGVAGVVESSFAVRLFSSIELFGVAPGGVIRSVCFANTRTNNLPRPDVQNLAGFAGRHDLLLVDWCGTVAVPPAEEAYAAYFAGAES